MENIYDFEFKSLQGDAFPMTNFEGQVLLVVNTASQCGFTPQYAGLQRLHDTYGPKGFSVIGFPCNQFGGQEPKNSDGIADFVYNVIVQLPSSHNNMSVYTVPRRHWLGWHNESPSSGLDFRI